MKFGYLLGWLLSLFEATSFGRMVKNAGAVKPVLSQRMR